MPMFETPNANALADLLPTQQRFMTQAGYVNPAMTASYQQLAGPTPMNANNGCPGQFVFPHMT